MHAARDQRQRCHCFGSDRHCHERGNVCRDSPSASNGDNDPVISYCPQKPGTGLPGSRVRGFAWLRLRFRGVCFFFWLHTRGILVTGLNRLAIAAAHAAQASIRPEANGENATCKQPKAHNEQEDPDHRYAYGKPRGVIIVEQIAHHFGVIYNTFRITGYLYW